MSITHEMTPEGELVLTRKFSGAPPRLMWKAWREEWHLQSWWAEAAKIKLEVGGKLLLSWPTNGAELRGRFLTIDPEKTLAFTWHWSHDKDAFPFVTTLSLEEADRGFSTDFKIVHCGLHPDEDKDLIAALVDGWEHFLPKLENYLAQMTLV